MALLMSDLLQRRVKACLTGQQPEGGAPDDVDRGYFQAYRWAPRWDGNSKKQAENVLGLPSTVMLRYSIAC